MRGHGNPRTPSCSFPSFPSSFSGLQALLAAPPDLLAAPFAAALCVQRRCAPSRARPCARRGCRSEALARGTNDQGLRRAAARLPTAAGSTVLSG